MTDTPKLWRDMTDADRGALLLAYHRGDMVEALFQFEDRWRVVAPKWLPDDAYRVKPKPVIGSITLHGVDKTYHSLHPTPTTGYDGDYTRMTFEFPTRDGKHVPGVYTSEDGLQVIVAVSK